MNDRELKEKLRAVLFVFTLMINVLICCAQVNGPQRVEVEVDYTGNDYEVIPLGEQGVLLFYDNGKDFKDIFKAAVVEKFDSNFKKSWTKVIPYPDKMTFVKQTVTEDYLYLLFKENGKKNAKIALIRLSIEAGESKELKGVSPYNIMVNDLAANGDILYFGGVNIPTRGHLAFGFCTTLALCFIPNVFGWFDYKYHSMVFRADFASGIVEKLNVDIKDLSEMRSVVASKEYNQFNVLNISKKDYNEPKEFLINSYDLKGNQINSCEIAVNPVQGLKDARIINTSTNNKIAIGPYVNISKPKDAYIGRFPEQIAFSKSKHSHGLFISKIEGSEQKFIKFYPYEKLEYTNARKNRKKEFKLENNLELQEVLKHNNDYIFIAEVYYPQYHPETNAKGQQVDKFDGYRFTYAITVAFNEDGDKLWEDAFEIKNILSMHLNPKVKVLIDNKNLVLAYSDGEKIYSKVIRNGEIISEKSSMVIKSKYDTDEVKKQYDFNIKYWYNNYYLAYGMQKIKNKKLKDNKKRRIFYLSKIAFD